ncbi:MAG: hypothetical protein K8T89_02205, partial [Planctomycetes bacterium]|nr:hypothetical protein [Planctomycetota bacterium]
MRSVLIVGLTLVGIGVLAFSGSKPQPVAAADKEAVTYAKDIKPILEASCYNCHNSNKKKGGVDLKSSFAGVARIVKAEKPDDSKLFKCLIGKGAKLMPPKNSLPDEQIALIKS